MTIRNSTRKNANYTETLVRALTKSLLSGFLALQLDRAAFESTEALYPEADTLFPKSQTLVISPLNLRSYCSHII